MRSGAGAGHAGYLHEAAFYGSDDEFVDIVRPFLRDAVDAGEPAVVACGDHNESLLRRAMDVDALRFVPGSGQYARPGVALRTFRAMFRDMVDSGAAQIRVVGDVPHPGIGAEWHAWMRYEAAVNVAFDDLPLWGLCPYDSRTAPEEVLDDVACTHAFLATADGDHRRNPSFVEPATFLNERIADTAPPSDLGRPDLVLESPGPREARMALTACAGGELNEHELEDLAVVASELVANAHHHGRPPARVKAWLSSRRIVVSVTDDGTGPADPLVGLVPPPPGVLGGRGLWLAHQLCHDIRMFRRDGYEVVFSIGEPGNPSAMTA